MTATMSPAVRRLLLNVIMSSPGERAQLIGQLHAGGQTPRLVDLLIDLEADRGLALALADALKETL